MLPYCTHTYTHTITHTLQKRRRGTGIERLLKLYKWHTKEEQVERDRRCDRKRKGRGRRGEKQTTSCPPLSRSAPLSGPVRCHNSLYIRNRIPICCSTQRPSLSLSLLLKRRRRHQWVVAVEEINTSKKSTDEIK